MKFLVAIVFLVGSTLFSTANADRQYFFDNLTRTQMESPPNDALSVTMNMESGEDQIQYLQEINQYNSLLIRGILTNLGTGEQTWTGGSFNLCNSASLKNLDQFAMLLFKRTLVPQIARNKWCPVAKQTYSTPRFRSVYPTRIGGDPLPLGNYQISYSALSSSGQSVFTSLVYTFSLNTPPIQINA